MNLLVICTSEYLTLRLLKCLAPLRATVHVLGTVRGGAVRVSRYCRRYHSVRPEVLAEPSDEARALIERLCRRHDIEAILPSGMAGGLLLAALRSEALGAPTLPLARPETLKLLNNKWTFSQMLAEAGLPQPSSRLMRAPGDALVLDLPFPVIAKPLELDAGRGVVRCDTPDDLRAHLERNHADLPILVQEYIPGADVGLGLLAENGEVLASSLQKQNTDSGGVEFLQHEAALQVGRQLLSRLAFDGIAHFDMRLDARDGSVKVLECNPRFWASLPFCMLAGVNFADLGIQLALGRKPAPVSAGTLALTFPSRALAGALRGRGVSGPSRQALGLTLADPLPQVCLGAGRVGNKVSSLLRGAPK